MSLVLQFALKIVAFEEKEIADFNQVKTQKSLNAHWEFCNR